MSATNELRSADGHATFSDESELVDQIGQSVEGHRPSRATVDLSPRSVPLKEITDTGSTAEHHSPEFHLDYWRRVYGNGSCFVYVIQAGDNGPIKVGISNDPVRRLRSHQTSNHEELKLLFVRPGARQEEAVLHARLEHAHLRGEWFSGPAVAGFLTWMEKHVADNLESHRSSRLEPEFHYLTKPKGGKGLPSGAYIGTGLQSYWRTGDGKKHEVTVRFVDPETLDSKRNPPPKRRPRSENNEPWNGKVPDWLKDAA